MKNSNTKRPSRTQSKSTGNERSHASRKAPQSRTAGASAFDSRRDAERIDLSSVIAPRGIKTNKKLPELLAPAGSIESLRAAIKGGADAVYFGGGGFNARINAKNFDPSELREAIELLHAHGKRAYITLNTLVHNRELEDYLRFAEEVYLAGADAIIVADLGGASAIHRHLPNLELHASTQMSGHNLAQAKLLSSYGFSRMVCARELPRDDLEHLVKNSPIEIEAFTHGALCVCHSGQCLFSSIVGGRSGNRGECAQPCRLPYKDENGKECYPLSLKDLTLAHCIRELTDAGVHSLKIEGRMKSPEYVFGVVKAFRTLLDENRNASGEELSRLARIFSRGGFTDGYYKRKISSDMLGIRSDEEKKLSRIALTSSDGIEMPREKKTPVSLYASVLLGEPMSLRIDCGDISVTSYGAEPEMAINAPLSAENIKKNLTKLGATPFSLGEYVAVTDDNIIVPISALNSLRREAVDMLTLALSEKNKREGFEKFSPLHSEKQKIQMRTARFHSPAQMTDKAREYFDIIYLPLQSFSGECEGVILPPVILDSEMERVEKMLARAKDNGARYALVGNLGAMDLAKRYGFEIHGDFRFNVYNDESALYLEKLGVKHIMLSPELTLPQIRDVKGEVSCAVYGRLPLMLLEKCVAREISSCEKCNGDKVALTDRRGVSFPVLREFEHRSVICNSAPTYMADREADMARAGIKNRHFIFSTETREEVDKIINSYKHGLPVGENERIRRI